jgi:hypothetical protein
MLLNLADLIPDADTLTALEPEELGLRLLHLLASLPEHYRPIDLDSVLNIAIGPQQLPGQAPVPPGPYPPNRRPDVEEAIGEAWAWLEGAALLIKDRRYREPNKARVLSRRARQLAQDPEGGRALSARRIPKDVLHPKIRDDVWALYHRGKYDTAVFEAMKAVEIHVREAAGLAAADIGTKLMRKAFDGDRGRLTGQILRTVRTPGDKRSVCGHHRGI